MPAAASATACPSLTSANANTRTHAAAKNIVVVRTSQLRASIATSFLRTSHAVRMNMSGRPDQRAVTRPQPGRRGFVGQQAAITNQRDACHEAVRQIHVV